MDFDCRRIKVLLFKYKLTLEGEPSIIQFVFTLKCMSRHRTKDFKLKIPEVKEDAITLSRRCVVVVDVELAKAAIDNGTAVVVGGESVAVR